MKSLTQVHPLFNLLQCTLLFSIIIIYFILFLLFDWTENVNKTLRFLNNTYINIEEDELQLQIW